MSARTDKLNFSVVYHKDYPEHKFLIMEQPKPTNTKEVIKGLHRHHIQVVVRVCNENEFDYSKEFEEAGIACEGLPYVDGRNPTPEVIAEWLNLVDRNRELNKRMGHADEAPDGDACSELSGIAVHCVAGLGRAPVLVAVAYIEEGMSNMDAVNFVRQVRKGAINSLQLKFLQNYKRRKTAGGCCTIL